MRGSNRYDEAVFQRRLWTPGILGAATVLLWLDASDLSTITTVSGNVSTWKDKSGNAKDATQSNASFRPPFTTNSLNGMPVVNTTGGSTMDFASTISTAAGWMAVSVYRFVTRDVAAQYLIAGTSKGLGVGGTTGTVTNYFGYDGTNLRSAAGNAPTGSYELHSWMPANLYLNGTESSYDTSNTVGALTTLNTMFTRPDSTSLVFKGDLAELVILNASTADARQRIEGYMAWKWGLKGNLPGSHPYANAPPTIGT